MTRPDGREPQQLRPWKFAVGVQKDPPGSVQVSSGDTVVLCAATVQESLPEWLQKKSSPHSWVTAEYAMLPGSTPGRVQREGSGRWEEIQRLIGRSLRSAVELRLLGPRTIIIDCDVLQADGGTRTAAITGGWVALALALRALRRQGKLAEDPLRRGVCAVACALVEGRALLDPCYREDAAAGVDMNFVLDDQGRFVEVQGTAEGRPFTDAELAEMAALARLACPQLIAAQRKALGSE